MTVDLAALAKLASELHEEPPFWFDEDYLGTTSGGWLDAPAAAFIAAASPDVVAALVRLALAAKVALPAVEYAAGVQAQAGLGDPLPELRAALEALQ